MLGSDPSSPSFEKTEGTVIRHPLSVQFPQNPIFLPNFSQEEIIQLC